MVTSLSGMGRPKKKEPTEPLRLPQSVVKRIRRLASHLGKDPGDYVAERFASVLDKDEKKMVEDIAKERNDPA